jgi:hypothetical protein
MGAEPWKLLSNSYIVSDELVITREFNFNNQSLRLIQTLAHPINNLEMP